MRGLEYAIKLGWFNFRTFSLSEYEHYERLENGDLNWIVPQKFVAFSSPSEKPIDKYGVFLSNSEPDFHSERLRANLQKARSHDGGAIEQ